MYDSPACARKSHRCTMSHSHHSSSSRESRHLFSPKMKTDPDSNSSNSHLPPKDSMEHFGLSSLPRRSTTRTHLSSSNRTAAPSAISTQQLSLGGTALQPKITQNSTSTTSTFPNRNTKQTRSNSSLERKNYNSSSSQRTAHAQILKEELHQKDAIIKRLREQLEQKDNEIKTLKDKLAEQAAITAKVRASATRRSTSTSDSSTADSSSSITTRRRRARSSMSNSTSSSRSNSTHRFRNTDPHFPSSIQRSGGADRDLELALELSRQQCDDSTHLLRAARMANDVPSVNTGSGRDTLRTHHEHMDSLLSRTHYSTANDPLSQSAMGADHMLSMNIPEDASYEELLRLDESIVKVGLDPALLYQFPRRRAISVDTSRSCSICMSEYEIGEEIVTLPCLCVFHSECCEKWLKNNKTCAVCRCELDQANLYEEH